MKDQIIAQPERKPQWSDQPPTEPGWYWFKTRREIIEYPIWVQDGTGAIDGHKHPLTDFIGQWAGPIPIPE